MHVAHQLNPPDMRVPGPVMKRGSLLKKSTAHLDRLPNGLEFPEGLRERISFDPVRGRLVFHGFMSLVDYYLLRELSDDPDYVRAVDQLHENSSCAIHRASVLPLWMWLLAGCCLTGAALFWWCWLVAT